MDKQVVDDLFYKFDTLVDEFDEAVRTWDKEIHRFTANVDAQYTAPATSWTKEQAYSVLPGPWEIAYELPKRLTFSLPRNYYAMRTKSSRQTRRRSVSSSSTRFLSPSSSLRHQDSGLWTASGFANGRGSGLEGHGYGL